MILPRDLPPLRLAVVLSHPTQYYSPWFRWLQAHVPQLHLQVFYLWNFGLVPSRDPGFQQELSWDLPLLDGYQSTFVANRSPDPGTHHFNGLDNPKLISRLLLWRPDVILLFGYNFRSHLNLLLDPRLRRIPVLFRGDSHGLCPESGLTAILKSALRRLLFRRLWGALAVGEANASWLHSCGISACRLVRAPHAVDNNRFQAAAPEAEREAGFWRQQLGIHTTAPVLLFAGKFEPKKQPLLLLDAFLALNHPEAVLVFVGSGPLESTLRQRLHALPPGRVIVEGFHNQSAMPRVYALADLVILPSLGRSETWGLCINEAMAMARPVVVSSHVGCGPDLVIPGRTGWLFAAGDHASLTTTLAEALSDRHRLRRMGKAARRHIAAYSYRQASAGLVCALERIHTEAQRKKTRRRPWPGGA